MSVEMLARSAFFDAEVQPDVGVAGVEKAVEHERAHVARIAPPESRQRENAAAQTDDALLRRFAIPRRRTPRAPQRSQVTREIGAFEFARGAHDEEADACRERRVPERAHRRAQRRRGTPGPGYQRARSAMFQ